MNESSVGTMRTVDEDDSMDANDRSVGRESVDGRTRARAFVVAPPDRSRHHQSNPSPPFQSMHRGWLFPSPARHTRVFLTRYLSRLDVSRGASIDAHRSIDIDRHRSLSSMGIDVFIDARIDRCRDEDDVDDGGDDGSE